MEDRCWWCNKELTPSDSVWITNAKHDVILVCGSGECATHMATRILKKQHNDVDTVLGYLAGYFQVTRIPIIDNYKLLNFRLRQKLKI